MMKNNKNRATHRRSEAGNAFYMILIAVVLFGALMYSFSRNARQGQSNLSSKQAEILAGEVIDYAQRMERAVGRLIGQGCSEQELSFATPAISAYPANPDAPVEETCHVFSAAGGNLRARAPADLLPGVSGFDIRPSGGASLENIGTWDAGDASPHQDLVVWIGPLSEDICLKINRMIGLEGAPPSVATVDATYYGVPVSDSRFGSSRATLGTLKGRMSGCVQITGTPTAGQLAAGYHYYQVLHMR